MSTLMRLNRFDLTDLCSSEDLNESKQKISVLCIDHAFNLVNKFNIPLGMPLSVS